MPLRKTTIRVRQSLGLLGIALSALVTLTILFLAEGRLIVEGEQRQEQAGKVLLRLREVEADLLNSETGQRGYLLSEDKKYLAPYTSGAHDIDDHLRLVAQGMADDADRLRKLDRLKALKDDKFAEMAETVRLQAAGNSAAAVRRLRDNTGRQMMDEMRAIITDLMDSVRDERTLVNEETRNRIQRAQYAFISIGLVLIITVGLAATLLARLIRQSSELSLRLETEATHDSLTDLPNRRLLLEWLPKMMDRATRLGASVAVFFLDLDGFKKINDDLGHDAGDEVLKIAARRLGSVLRESDFLARYGGDEFAIVVGETSSHEQLERLAERLVQIVASPLPPEMKGYGVGVSVGIAIFPEHGDQAAEILKAADDAMYQAKRAGKGRCRFAGQGAPMLP
jgi:diguanylate cyclase (GGDEF)-like protein